MAIIINIDVVLVVNAGGKNFIQLIVKITFANKIK